MTTIGPISIAVMLALLLGVSASHARLPNSEPGVHPGSITLVAAAPTKPANNAKANKKAKVKVKKKQTESVTYRDDKTDKYGSRETEGQRSERLSRECRGAVNAGACAGYTR